MLFCVPFQHRGVSLVGDKCENDAEGKDAAPGRCGEGPAHTLGDEGYAVGGDSRADVDTAVAHTADGGGSADSRKSAGQTGDEQEVDAVHGSADKRGDKERCDAEECAVHIEEEDERYREDKRDSEEHGAAGHLVGEHVLSVEDGNDAYADDGKDGQNNGDEGGLGDILGECLGVQHRQP